ncbi:uncharacterized protein BDR25DRAFT_334336 [Lindgomyces ingoldianus]|uniref:Uncharacterized protein n=1 Tax=Lindgomyces ingoldianus TaxID=673940 RepID=A0ACB6QV68_9PLEO|nr:uncharacterized protein BDR25DRAFT_334336 [Lindgomyces ingoldianus]KAF2470741.1 hypothetical protein BDR25DRAFT_334336 [Lindgomyces ingoldianus]
MSDPLGKSNYTSLTLWDIDREFQNSYDAYEQWLSKNRPRRRRWVCFGSRNQDDELGKTLSLGRQIRELMEDGQDCFGRKFERGDSICHSILESQLLRMQQEVTGPLLDASLSRIPVPIPHDVILTTVKSIRRTCLHALRDQFIRLSSPSSVPFLPPPRFSINFCPFATQLQKDRSNSFQSRKVRPHDRFDEREICPYCLAHISVSSHSGLPNYRQLLFQYHLPCSVPEDSKHITSSKKSTFACTSCYKTFDNAYGFLDHMYQKEIGSDRSCQKKWSSNLDLRGVFVESNPDLVEKCLKNCLKRELTRIRTLKKSGPGLPNKDQVVRG